MSLKISILVFILLSWVKYYCDASRFDCILTHPNEVVYRDEGSNVSFEWNFHIGSRTQVEFIFGEWAADPGYVRKEILNVQGHNQVKKRRGFEKKLDWRGNVYKCVNCTAEVVMYDLTSADFKSYGVVIVLGVDRRPLTNWLRLVKTEAKQPYLDRILTYPDGVVYGDEGNNVSFEWNFQIGSWPNPRPKVVEFVFGEWAFPGYVRKKILNVQGHNQVNKRRGFEKKLDWMGNVYECVECTAEVVMYNLTRADFKLYGVDIELGVDRSPLTNWLRLVKTEPASITKWTQNVEVQEGNSTTIECRASGLPPPSVKIERKNQTLQTCYDMKPCVYKIQAAKSEDQGEYVCSVQQGNSSVSRSSNLTVVKTRKTRAAKLIADERLSPNTSSPSPSTAHTHSVNTMWGWSAYLAIPAVVLLIMKEGPIPRSYFFVIILAGIADTTTTATTTCPPLTEIQTSGSSLTGYINEKLDIPCIFQRQKGNVVVDLYLCNPKVRQRFVKSTWNISIQNYTKVCFSKHRKLVLCDSWTTSYVHGDQTHFVIRNTPWDLNWCQTQCIYEHFTEFNSCPDKVEVIRLKARGNVNGTIQLKLFIPKGNILITFKINMIPVLRFKISNGSLSERHCVKDHRNVCQIARESSNHHCVPGYDVCQEHMNSSSFNSSFVVFIFENTPSFLNNSKLYYSINFFDHEKLWNDPIHPNETIFLLNKDTTTTATTTYPPPTENTTSNVTFTSATLNPPNESRSKKNGLTTGAIIAIIVGVLVIIILPEILDIFSGVTHI